MSHIKTFEQTFYPWFLLNWAEGKHKKDAMRPLLIYDSVSFDPSDCQ